MLSTQIVYTKTQITFKTAGSLSDSLLLLQIVATQDT